MTEEYQCYVYCLLSLWYVQNGKHEVHGSYQCCSGADWKVWGFYVPTFISDSKVVFSPVCFRGVLPFFEALCLSKSIQWFWQTYVLSETPRSLLFLLSMKSFCKVYGVLTVLLLMFIIHCFTVNWTRVQLGQKSGCAFSCNCLRSVGGMFAQWYEQWEDKNSVLLTSLILLLILFPCETKPHLPPLHPWNSQTLWTALV